LYQLDQKYTFLCQFRGDDVKNKQQHSLLILFHGRLSMKLKRSKW